jgi:hypothetical protein
MADTFYDVEWSVEPNDGDNGEIFQRRFSLLKDAQDFAKSKSDECGDVVYVVERRTNDDFDEPAVSNIAEWVYSCGALERVEHEEAV